MKKTDFKYILFLLLMCVTLSVTAQTNFRHITYDEAINIAKAENKLVFMDFYTDWCGPCKMMMRDVFPQKEIGDFMNEKFVCIKLNAEKEGKELAKLYKVEAYPTFISIDTNKHIIFTKVGGSSAETFINEIERLIDPNKTPERMKQRYESGERNADLIKNYAAYLTSEAKQKHNGNELQTKVYDIVKDYFNSLDESAKLKDENLFIYKDYIQSVDDEIARFMISHRKDFSKTIKKEINEIIKRTYEAQIYNYFTNSIPYNAQIYEQTKKECNELGLNNEHQYDACFQFIECHSKGDMNAYLTLCEKEYNSLLPQTQRSLLLNISRIIPENNKNIRQRASKFIRSLLPKMEVGQMLFVIYELINLESE